MLDKAATEFGGNTMLLDCNNTLLTQRFDDESKVWADSEIKSWLNGNDFLNNDNVFTLSERTAIVSSTKENPSTYDGDGNGWDDEILLDWTPLNNEKIFLLDAKEATRLSYGYANTAIGELDSNKSKTGSNLWWWLRSSDRNEQADLAGKVGRDGIVMSGNVYSDCGVSPAFNIDLASVIFSSVISGKEYKLTLKDENLGITSGVIERDGNTITVQYEITGANKNEATQVSVLIMDSAYSAGTVKTSGYTYEKLTVTTWGTNSEGTFELPAAYADKVCGTDYFVYILAEDVNTGNATDYASTPTLINIPSITTKSLSDGKVGSEYSKTLEATNTTGEKKWSIIAGALPDGLSLSEEGVITGTPTKAGTFDFTLKVEAANGSATKELSIKIVDKDAETCTVIFDVNGHGEDFTKIVTKGDPVVKPDDPKAKGYDFGGWFKDKDCTTAYDFGTPVTEDITIYAKWIRKPGFKPRDNDDSNDEPAPEKPSNPVNPNLLSGVFFTNGSALPGVIFLKENQGTRKHSPST